MRNKDREFILLNLESKYEGDYNSGPFICAHKSLRKDRDFVIKALKHCPTIVVSAHKSLKKDRKFALSVLHINGELLKYFPRMFKMDKELVAAAVENSVYAIYYIHESLRLDYDFSRFLINIHYDVWRLCHMIWKRDKELVKFAVKCHGIIALKWASKQILSDRTFALEMISIDSNCIRYFYYCDINMLFAALKYQDNINVPLFNKLKSQFNFHKWRQYIREKYISDGNSDCVKIYKILADPDVAKKYFNVFKHGNGIKFYPMEKQSDLRIIY